MSARLERTIELADSLVAQLMARPVLPWMWGPGLLGYALARLQAELGDQRYLPYLQRFVGAHTDAVVHSSDTAAPALITFELARQGVSVPNELTERALFYVAHAPRLPASPVVDHLGTSGYARLYPASGWVDSLMMFGVFPALVGAHRHDQHLLDQAAALPGGFAKLLQDRNGLWSHSWWAPAWHSPRGRRFPANTFWARGNGWVIASLTMILGAIGLTHPKAREIVSLLATTSSALACCQRRDGTWRTLLDHRVLDASTPAHGTATQVPSEPTKHRHEPTKHRHGGPGFGYRELSASCLIAAGWLNATRLKVLGDEYAQRASTALDTCLAAIRPGRSGLELPEISGPTIPVPLLPKLGYLLVPRIPNASYGVAALILAALAAEQSRLAENPPDVA